MPPPQQETYSLLSLDEEVDEDRTANAQYAPLENMLSATFLVVSLLEGHVGPEGHIGPEGHVGPDHHHHHVRMPVYSYAIQGGFSMQLRGGRQSTRDVDVVTNIKMRGVWEAIRGEER